MADIQEAIRRLKYLFETHGADQVTAAMQAVTASTTGSERAALSLEKSFNSLERKYVSTVRAQQDYARVQEKVNDAVKQNPALQARANVIMEQAGLQYQAASRGLDRYGNALNQSTQQGRLARHEMINLSRQIQDVGVGIVSGQSPITILVQQGAQIADVFATSTGTLAGFFRQVGAGAARFLASTTGMVTSVAAIGTAIGYSAVSFGSGQRDIERSLLGIGRASGVTRDQINEIARATSSWSGISISQSREAASAFAATGKIYAENVGLATSLVDAYVRAGGDAAKGTEKFAAAFLDPAKGAVELNKELGFLDVAMLENIRSLQAQGKLQEAQTVLGKAMLPALEKQAKLTGNLSKGWNVVTNSMSDYMDTLGRQARRDILGIDDSQIVALKRAREELERLEEQAAKAPPRDPRIAIQRFDTRPLEAARAEVERLQKAIASMNEEAKKKALDQLGLEAKDIERAIMPVTAEIEKMQGALSRLRLYREQTGGPVTGAEQVGTVRLRELQEQEAATVRLAQATQQIAALYPGMSIETAKQLFDLQQQLGVAQARTGAEKLVAQEIATTNQLLAQGKTLEEATAMAAAQRAVAQAQINSAVQGQNLQLQNQLQVSNAVGGAAKIEAQHRATIVDLLRQGVDASLAVLNADLQRANALAQINSAAKEQLASLKDQNAVSGAITGQERIQAEGQATFNKLVRDGVDELLASEIAAQQVANAIAAATAAVEQQIIALKESTALIKAQMEGTEIATAAQIAYNRAIRSGADEQVAARLAMETRINLEIRELAKLENAYDNVGRSARRAGESWFKASDPGKQYTSTMPGMEYIVAEMQKGNLRFNEAIAALYNASEIPIAAWERTAQGFENLDVNRILEQGGGVSGAINKLVGELGGIGEEINKDRISVINRLIDVLPEEGQAAEIGKVLAQVKQQPISLAREELIKDLTDKLKALQDSTDGLNDTIGGILSPFYSQDPRTTKLGFRAGSVGNADWLTGATNQTAIDTILGKGATAPGGITITAPGGVTVTAPGSTVPIIGTPTSAWPGITTGTVVTPPSGDGLGPNPNWGRFITAPGMASGGSFVVGGGYSTADNRMAQFPVASGEQVVVNRRPQDARPIVVHNDNRIIIQGSVDQDTLSRLKISRYQQTQRMRNSIAAA